MNDNESREVSPSPAHDAPARPTYAPVAMALGVMLLLWGIVAMWVMSVAGAGLIVWSFWIWINELRKA